MAETEEEKLHKIALFGGLMLTFAMIVAVLLGNFITGAIFLASLIITLVVWAGFSSVIEILKKE